MKHIKEIVESYLKEKTEGLPTGLKFLDENIGGLYPGELTVICGDSDSGKTALMIRQINCLAIDGRVPVLVVLCTNEETFLANMAAYYCSIITDDVRQVFTDEECSAETYCYLDKLLQAPIYFVNIADFEETSSEELHKFIQDNNIKAVFVENVQWINNMERNHEVIAQPLKALAKEEQVAVVAEYHLWTNDDFPPLSILQFEKDDVSMMADNIIGMLDFQNHNILVDEQGKDISGEIRMKIIKHKGILAKNKETRYRKAQLMVRNNHHATYIGTDRKKLFDGNSSLSSLIKELDCEVEDISSKQ